MKIVVILLSLLLFFFDCYVIFWWIRHKKLDLRKEQTMSAIASLGHVIHINGKHGKGKTTTGCGIVIALSEHLLNLAKVRMEDIRLSLREIDFNIVEAEFDEYYNILYSAEDTIKVILSNYKFRTYYSDFLSIYDKEDMLNDYLIYYYILFYRGIEVYSTGYLFNVVSGKAAKHLDPSSMQIKNVVKKRNYQGGLFTIKFNDEKNISNGNEKSNNSKLKSNGYREYLALKRHEGKATCYDISPGQVAIDVQAQERRQNDVNLDIFDRNDSIGDYKVTRFVLEKIKSILFLSISFFLHFKAFFKRLDYNEVKMQYSKKVGKWRNFEYKISQLCKLLKRQGLVRIRCKAYYSADDVGKKDPSLYDKIIFYFPIYYVYGNINTYEYSKILKEFSNMNESSINEKISLFDSSKRFDLFMEVLNIDS